MLVSLPTGGGKTFATVRILFAAIGDGLRKVLWVAPQRLLLEQAEGEFRQAWWEQEQRVPLTITSLERPGGAVPGQAEVRFGTLQRLIREQHLGRWDVVIVDEAHHLENNVFGATIERLKALGGVLVGLSATPGRRVAAEFDRLVDTFERTLITPPSLGGDPVTALIEAGVYSRIESQSLQPTRLSDQERVLARSRKSRPEVAAQSPGRLDAVVEHLVRNCGGTKGVVFGYSVAHCHVLAAALAANGLRVAVVGSAQSPWANATAIQRFREGELDWLVNVKYVATGVDFPKASVAVLTVPVGSPILFEQVVGRIARGPAVGGTERATIVDFDGHMRRHKSLQSYRRFESDWT